MNGLFASMICAAIIAFAAISDEGNILTPAEAAQAQLDAYNARDIDAFVAVYSENVQAFTHPNTLRFEGNDELRRRYRPYFDKTPDLHVEVTKRMVQGNFVIDAEEGVANGHRFTAIAIYQMNPGTGKIDKVWFIQ